MRGGVEEGEVGGLQLLLKDEDVDDNVEEDAKDAGVVPVVASHRGDGGCETRGAGERGEGRGERGGGADHSVPRRQSLTRTTRVVV